MAFDNAGAEWLQRGEQIDNPYFGASMLRCGEIRREFKPLSERSVNGAGDTAR
jgi:Cu(I)/Ag(I) efflux system membrane fusion protein